MDTYSLYLALAEKELEDCIRPKMKAKWERLRSKDCTDSFTADAVGAKFFPRRCCDKHKKHDKSEPGLFKEEFRCTEMLCLCGKTYCCYDQSGGGSLEKHRHVLNEKVSTSTNSNFRTNNQAVAAYKPIKKRLPDFWPKKNCREWWNPHSTSQFSE